MSAIFLFLLYINNIYRNMATNEFKELVNKITHGVPSTFLKDLDMTWNMPNLLLNSNNMLVAILAKTSTLPMIPNTDDVYSSLNMPPVTEIHNINAQLNLLHILIQKYCVQQFTIGSLTHNIIDTMIDEFDEINEEKDINAFMEYISNVVKKGGNIPHKGGSPSSTTVLINCIFIIILLLSTSISGTNIESAYDVSLVTPSNIVNMMTLRLDESAFKKAIVDRNFSRTEPVNIEMALTAYDEKVEQEKNTIMGKLKYLIYTIPGASEKMNEYINNFNEKSRLFSKDAEKQCVDIMIKSYENKIFENLQQIDDIAATEEKINYLKSIQQQIVSSAPKELAATAIGAVAATAASLVTQDYVTPAGMWYGLVDKISNKISSVSSIEQEKEYTLESAKNSVLTREEKMDYNNKLFGFSKFYCQNSFNLKIEFQDSNIIVIGDKIDYLWIVKLIDTINTNIGLQDAAINSSTTMDVSAKKANSQILQNIKDRFDVLRKIVDAISNMIVNYGVDSSLTKEISPPSSKSLDNIQEYFDEQLNYLNSLLDELYEKKCMMPGEGLDSRCLEIRKKKLQEELELTKESAYIQQVENNITQMNSWIKNVQMQFNANLTKTDMEALWIATRTQFESYLDFGVNSLVMGKESLQRISKEGAKFVASPFVGFGEGVGEAIIELSGSIFKLLFTRPAGWGILFIIYMILTTVMGFSFIGTFKWAGAKIIAFGKWIGKKMIVLVYEVKRLGTQYILKPIATFVVDSKESLQETAIVPVEAPVDVDNYNRFLKQQEEGEIYNPDMKYGGRMRKKRLTKKHKKPKKTHKKNRLNKEKKKTKRGYKRRGKQTLTIKKN